MQKISAKLGLAMLILSVSFFALQTNVLAVVSSTSSASSSSSDGLIRPQVVSDSSISAFTDTNSAISSSTSSSGYSANQTIKLTLEKQIQSIFDKTEPVKLTIESGIDTDRLEISWTYDDKSLSLAEKSTEFKTIKKDTPLVLTYNFTPLKEGVNKVYVRVQAWQNEANYPEVSSIELTFNKDLEIVPQTSEYQNNLFIFNTFKTVILIVIAGGILGVAFLLLKRFFRWFEKD
ncbi:MAG: hypothetical protein WCO33_00560 [bacterium]